NKRVHQIAKERGLPSKELLEKLRAAGVEVKAASSNVDEAVVLRVLGDGGAPGEPDGADAQAPQAPARQAKTAPAASATSKARPAASGTAVAEPAAIRINSGSTVKDVAEYLDVPVPEVMKALMAVGEMKTLTQTLSDESIQVLASELGKDVEIVHAEEEAGAEP